MLQIQLNSEEEEELKKFRWSESSLNAMHALIILKSSKGLSTQNIAKDLDIHEHTVRTWIKRYKEHGINGLKRKFAPGKPRDLREMVKIALAEVIERSPLDFGYSVSLWTTSLLADWLIKAKNLSASQDTIERALKENEFHYKRSATKVPDKAPSNEDKLVFVEQMIKNITEEMKNSDCEVFALDESHFSNEPYVVSGWQKKLWSNSDSNTSKERKKDNIWLLKFQDKKVLLEKRATR